MRKIVLPLLLLLLYSGGLHAQSFVSTYGQKNVLLEVGGAAWNGWNPDVSQDIQEKILPYYPNAIIAVWHMSDSMAISGSSLTDMMGGSEMGCIDRGSAMFNVGRPFESYVGARSTMTSNFDVDILWTYDTSTREMDITVTGTALVSRTGLFGLNALIIQDSVPTTLPGYKQHNYAGTVYTVSCTGSPSWFNSAGPDIASSLFTHTNIVRKVLATGGRLNGDTVLHNPAAGAHASKHYTYTIPIGADPNRFSVIGMVIAGALCDSIENSVSTKRITLSGLESHTSDSFAVYVNRPCIGGSFLVTTNIYHPSMTVYTDYGDGTSDTRAILSGGYSRYANILHAYPASGTYTVKHKLFNGSVAIDSITYPFSFTLCNVIPVRFYLDGNSNCTKDGGEALINEPSFTYVDSSGVRIDTISATGGFDYTAYGTAGTLYRFTPELLSSDLTLSCPTAGYLQDTLRASTARQSANEFAEVCTGGGTSFDVRIFPTSRAGSHMLGANLLVDNLYCTPAMSTVSMFINPRYDFHSATPPPVSVSGGIATWDLGAMSAASGSRLINVRCDHAGVYPFGDTVHNWFQVMPITGDADPASNTVIRIDTVRAGFDPNYMDVTPSGYIPANTQLRYTIGFENTGNDTAFNIHVMDTLSDNVDFSSLRMVASSAEVITSKIKTPSGHNVIKFDFPAINLLDSSHHGLCDGIVIFDIHTTAGLTAGTSIYNRCGIYFDGNPVVMTNTVEDIVDDNISGVLQPVRKSIAILPNPVKEELTINTGSEEYTSVTIVNSLGQTLHRQQLSGRATTIQVGSLSPGLYYVILKGSAGVTVQKVVKM